MKNTWTTALALLLVVGLLATQLEFFSCRGRMGALVGARINSRGNLASVLSGEVFLVKRKDMKLPFLVHNRFSDTGIYSLYLSPMSKGS